MQETLTFERYELKYFVPEALVQRIRVFSAPYLIPDEYASKDPTGTYRINNLYWDSPSLALYWEHSRGNPDRFKLRIRTYGDSSGPRFLEVKRRIRRVIVKTRASISPREYEAVLAGDWEKAMKGANAGLLHEFVDRALLYGARPILSIRYQREAYMSAFQDGARLTFDRAICYQRTRESHLANPDENFIYVDGSKDKMGGVLMELKFTDLCPRWMAEMVKTCELERTGFSKYLTAVNHHLREANLAYDRWPQSVLGKLGPRGVAKATHPPLLPVARPSTLPFAELPLAHSDARGEAECPLAGGELP